MSHRNQGIGCIIKKKGSNKLHIKVPLYGHPFEQTTGLDDTEENRHKVRAFLDEVIKANRDGSLVFGDAFPGASLKIREKFAALEGRSAQLTPADITFGRFMDDIGYSFINKFVSGTMQDDYKAVLNARNLPFWSDKSFADINVHTVEQFATTLVKKDGGLLSKTTVTKVTSVMRKMINYAYLKYGWGTFKDPFKILKDILPCADAKESVRVLRFSEYKSILEAASISAQWYKPIIELMVLTGMIPSEIAALQHTDVTSKHISIHSSISRGRKKKGGKRAARTRNIKITDAIRRVIDELKLRKTPHLVTMEDGSVFNEHSFRTKVWKPKLVGALSGYDVPYCTRHTFIGWSLLLEIPEYVLTGLSGHSSKRMIFDVYGKYTDDLVDDYQDIKEYFGNDFCKVYNCKSSLGITPIDVNLKHPYSNRFFL